MSKRSRASSSSSSSAKRSRGMNRTGGFMHLTRPGELKFHDFLDSTGNTINEQGEILHSGTIIGIDQDDTASTRNGNHITVKTVQLRGYIRADTSGNTANHGKCRVIVYVDKQCNKTAATAAEIMALEQTPTNAGAINSYRNLAQSQRFWILHDKVYMLRASAGAYSGSAAVWANSIVPVSVFKDDLNIHVTYEGSGATVGSIVSNNIGVLCFATNGESKFFYKGRVRYTDA